MADLVFLEKRFTQRRKDAKTQRYRGIYNLHMKKIIIIQAIMILCFNSCVKTFVNYSLNNIQYPEWINNEYPDWINNYRKDKVEYNNTNFIIMIGGAGETNYTRYNLLINPRINWDNLYIFEISFVIDGEIIYFIKNKNIINDKNNMFTHLIDINIKDFPKYFRDIGLNETVEIQLTQIYMFDDNQMIIEVIPYIIKSFEDYYYSLF